VVVAAVPWAFLLPSAVLLLAPSVSAVRVSRFGYRVSYRFGSENVPYTVQLLIDEQPGCKYWKIPVFFNAWNVNTVKATVFKRWRYSGGPGGGRIKQEDPMDTSVPAGTDNSSNSSEPLNRFGPQDVEMSLPGARKPTAR
jgi:hypothetical protein